MNPLQYAVSRFLRGRRGDAFLKKFDVDPRRYWLLFDLFEKLSVRRELYAGATVDLKFLEVLCFGVTALLGIVLAALAPLTASGYLTIFLVWTTVVLLAVLVPETTFILINPVEGLVLAHHPINGATYTAAKLTRLLGLLLRFGVNMNIIPALAAGFLLKQARWFYPVNHVIAAAITGLLVALLCCSVFGLLIRFVPSARLKGVIRGAQLGLLLLFVGFRFLSLTPRALVRNFLPSFSPVFSLSLLELIQFPAQVFLLGHAVERQSHPVLALSLAGALGLTLVIGIRSLSADYLIRVHSVVHGVSGARMRRRGRSHLGMFVARFSGGQVSRAGFEYVRRMMVRDWEFLRRMARVWPLLAGVIAIMMTAASPFSGRTGLHIVPHLLGFMFIALSFSIVFGAEYKAMWVFLTVPGSAFRRFARGVYLSLFLTSLCCRVRSGSWCMCGHGECCRRCRLSSLLRPSRLFIWLLR